MKVTKEQSMAYTEVIEILKYIPKEEVEKIPEEKLNFFKANIDESYDFKIDTNKTFEEQILLEKTKVVLAILFRDYWATEEQREKIKAKEKYDIYLLEEEKREKYSSDNIFKEREKTELEEQKLDETTTLVEYKKESWYEKCIQFLKRIFGKKN